MEQQPASFPVWGTLFGAATAGTAGAALGALKGAHVGGLIAGILVSMIFLVREPIAIRIAV